MSIPNQKFQNQLHPNQLNVLERFDRGLFRFFDLEWHRKARKTTLLINLLIRECCRHKNRIYPYIGPTYKEARRIVWDDPEMLDAYLPDKSEVNWKKNEQRLSVTFETGSQLLILGADDPESLRGPTYHGAGIDEWSFQKLSVWTSVLRPIMTLSKDFWAMFLWTPAGVNHATEQQAKRKEFKNWYCETLKASESKLISQEELDEAKKEMPLVDYEREFECAHVTDEEMTLITSRMIDVLKQYSYGVEGKRRIISVDPGLGGDKCAVKAIENRKVIDKLDLYIRDEMKIVGELMVFSAKTGIDNFIVDIIGLGEGIWSRLSELKKKVQLFDSRNASLNTRCVNKKAEAFWYVMKEIQDGKVPYPEDAEIRRQLPIASRYKVIESSGTIKMAEKAEARKLLGCSPDDAESYVMGIYGEQFVEPEEIFNDWDLTASYGTVDNSSLAASYVN